MKHAITGKQTLKNGITIKWIHFVDTLITLKAAQAEAIRIQEAWFKGVTIRCWVESN